MSILIDMESILKATERFDSVSQSVGLEYQGSITDKVNMSTESTLSFWQVYDMLIAISLDISLPGAQNFTHCQLEAFVESN